MRTIFLVILSIMHRKLQCIRGFFMPQQYFTHILSTFNKAFSCDYVLLLLVIKLVKLQRIYIQIYFTTVFHKYGNSFSVSVIRLNKICTKPTHDSHLKFQCTCNPFNSFTTKTQFTQPSLTVNSISSAAWMLHCAIAIGSSICL